ncbi:MAG: peptide ABC transporter substrate-binding protein [Caldilineaceae bacterium]|nr:peptide ABC transporter substrate-binding protein [Caldilineaceae bacterium]
MSTNYHKFSKISVWRLFFIGLLALISIYMTACSQAVPVSEATTPESQSTSTSQEVESVPKATTEPEPTSTSQEIQEVPPEEQSFRFPWFEPPGSIDPTVAFGGYPIAINLFSGLVNREDPTQLDQAESVEVSEDGSIWTFKLKEGLKWSDGTPLTAHDYEYALKRYVDPDTASPLAFFAYYIKGAKTVNEGGASLDEMSVKAIDDLHLQIEFERPIGFAPALLTLWGFYPVPQEKIEKFGADWVEPENLITNGPWIIDSWEHDSEMVLVPNPNYHGAKPEVDKVILSLIQQPFVTDDGVALRAYENNEVDYADVPFAELDRVKDDPTLEQELHFGAKLRPVWINFDTSNEPWSDPKVRQAFALAIDRNLLSETVFKGIYQPMKSLIPASLLPENSRSVGPEYNVELAQQLLAEAGYPNGEGFPEFTLQGGSGPVNELLAPALQEQWRKKLGITSMKIELLERKTFDELVQQTYKEQPFDLTIGGLTADFLDPGAYFDTWLSTRQEFYSNHWENAEYDQIVNTAGEASDIKIRAELYEKANEILVDELPAIPLWLDGWAYVLKPHVKQFNFAFSNIEPKFETIELSE